MKKKNRTVLKAVKTAEIIALSLALSSFAAVNTNQPPEKGSKEQSQYFTLSEYDGRIAVFEYGNDKPIEVFDTFLSSLPYTEQTELINGITVSDRSELQKLIEDYTS